MNSRIPEPSKTVSAQKNKSNKEAGLLKYYEELWSGHYKGVLRDQVATGTVRELIDYFVTPTFRDINGGQEASLFSDGESSVFVTAGSGIGKSTMIDMMLLSCIIGPLIQAKSAVLSENSKAKQAEYESFRRAFFGQECDSFFPVYIDSNNANTSSYDDLLELAEFNTGENFCLLVDTAFKNGNLLLLIDSIDEVESSKQTGFFDSIKKTLRKYKKVRCVFASRSLTRRHLPFSCQKVEINKLSIDSITRITQVILNKEESDKFIERIKNEKHLLSLVSNPYMLMIALENKDIPLIHQLIQSIVNAIIVRRWEKHHYKISASDIMLLLGYLACVFVFDNRDLAGLNEIRQCFANAQKNIKLNGLSYDVAERDINYFLGTLSCQSGILNVRVLNQVEKYYFQDTLVMCWLAAYYIITVRDQSPEVADREGVAGIWKNMLWLDKLIRSSSVQHEQLSPNSVNTIVLSIVMSEKSTVEVQKSFLYYLVCRDATSTNEKEKENIASGYRDLVENTFGENDITNKQDGDAVLIIHRMTEGPDQKKEN